MGSSIVLILAFPLLIVGTLFSMLTGAIFGYPTTEVVLPYDEATGIVWEYDNVDDPDIKLVDTKIENGKQIFIFEGTNRNDFENCGKIMELVFTDKNGNEEVYYAFHGSALYAPNIYSEEECQLIEVTMTADSPVEGGVWTVSYDDIRYILREQASASETKTFTTVITPFNERGEYSDLGKFDVKFIYTDSHGFSVESATVVYELENGTHFISEIKR